MDWPAAEQEFRRAIELNPNYAFARAFYSIFLTSMGRPQEGRAQIEQALELDPHNARFLGLLGLQLLRQRQYDEAIAQFREVLRKEPDSFTVQESLADAFHQKGMYEEELAERKKFFALRGNSEVTEALERGYAQGGYAGAMRWAAEKLVARSKFTYVQPTRIAQLYAHAGEKDRALEWLEKAYEERAPKWFI